MWVLGCLLGLKKNSGCLPKAELDSCPSYQQVLNLCCLTVEKKLAKKKTKTFSAELRIPLASVKSEITGALLKRAARNQEDPQCLTQTAAFNYDSVLIIK